MGLRFTISLLDPELLSWDQGCLHGEDHPWGSVSPTTGRSTGKIQMPITTFLRCQPNRALGLSPIQSDQRQLQAG